MAGLPIRRPGAETRPTAALVAGKRVRWRLVNPGLFELQADDRPVGTMRRARQGSARVWIGTLQGEPASTHTSRSAAVDHLTGLLDEAGAEGHDRDPMP